MIAVGAATVVVLALAAAAFAAFAPLPTTARELAYVIPPGTAARVKAGVPFTVLPSPVYLTLDIRDILVLTNDDEVIHQLGPVILGPRQTYRIPFRRPGRFQYACSLHASGTLTLVIKPAPTAGLARLRWRLEHALAASFRARRALSSDGGHARALRSLISARESALSDVYGRRRRPSLGQLKYVIAAGSEGILLGRFETDLFEVTRQLG